MSLRGSRWFRARDYATTSLGSAFLALALIFLAGRIWFRGLFAAAIGTDPLVFAGCFGAAAVLLGIHHTFMKPPLPSDDGQAYKAQD